MKKIFIYIVSGLVVISPSMAKFYSNGARECYCDDDGNDWFWFCGNQSKSCSGNGVSSRNKYWFLYHGDEFQWDNKTYWCCNGSQTKSGTFVEAAKWETTETKTIDVAGGTCTYNVTTDVCGNVTDEPCTRPDNCTDGNVMRNEACVQNCIAPKAFESETSNTCIDCETTKYQGIIMVDGFSVCKKCDSSVQFFDATKRECVEKSTYKQYNKLTLRKCWRCPTQDLFQQCIDGGTENNVKKQCKLDDAVDTDD